jgi:hypothetical protein
MNLKEKLAEAEKRVVTACLTCPLPDCDPSIDCQFNKAKVARKNLMKQLSTARKRMEHARIEMVKADKYVYEVRFDNGDKVLRKGISPQAVMDRPSRSGSPVVFTALVSSIPMEN